MEEIKKIIAELERDHSMTRRLLAHNAGILLNVFKGLKIRRATPTIDDHRVQITVYTKYNGKDICWIVTSDNIKRGVI